jgi:hypothetical protein
MTRDSAHAAFILKTHGNLDASADAWYWHERTDWDRSNLDAMETAIPDLAFEGVDLETSNSCSHALDCPHYGDGAVR